MKNRYLISVIILSVFTASFCIAQKQVKTYSQFQELPLIKKEL